MKISIIHPSRSRPGIAGMTRNKWLLNAHYPEDIEYILSLDRSDPQGKMYRNPTGKILFNNNISAIGAINHAARHATGDLIIVVSDDFDCLPHWDTLLLKELEGKRDFLVKTPDGLQPTIITLPIMDRTYYERFGYVYHPDYKHMFADTEMTAVGHLLGKVIHVDLLFEHKHYSLGKSKKDAVNKKNDATWHQGKNFFHKRLKTNFGIENPVMAYNEIKWK